MYPPIFYLDEVFRIIDDAIVPGVDSYRYWVSNYGVVFDSKTNRYPSLINSNGYMMVCLHTIDGFKKFLLHRLVGMAFIDGDFTLQINHKDGIKSNCKYYNLEWVTPRENLIHAVNMGLNYRGEDKPNAKITNEQANIICKCIENRIRVEDILNEAGLEDNKTNRRIIADIKRGRTYSFISSNYSFNNYALRDRDLSNDEVEYICKLFSNNPSITYPEILTLLGLNYLTGSERKSMLSKIGSIKLRKAYRDISYKYNW